MRARPGNASQGLLKVNGRIFPCALGRGGISAFKREGDGATPLARLEILSGFVRPSPRAWPAGSLRLAPIAPWLGWCDAPGDRNYNRPVALPYPAGHERMWRDDDLYDCCIVLDWNIRPRTRSRGSAIFLHLARPGYQPTEGCIAVSRPTMRQLLPLLEPGSEIRVIR